MTLGASGRPELQIEGVPVSRALARVATPFYITSLAAVGDRVRSYRDALQSCFPLNQLYYALKANWGEPVVGVVRDNGCGFDIVSSGELRHLQSLGVRPESICFAGVGKSRQEIEEALEAEVGILNVEHLGELAHALKVLQTQRSTTRLALRLNPCLEVDTHPHLRTGALDSKFGILKSHILRFLDDQYALFNSSSAHGLPLRQSVCGLHIHVGSQLLSGRLFELVVEALVDLAHEMVSRGFPISHLDFGGGLGVGPAGVPVDASDIWAHVRGLHRALHESVDRRPRLRELWGGDLSRVQICLEPGRSVVASSTAFISQVLYTRENDPEHRFAFVDGGMNDFPRPSLYGAEHSVILACGAGDHQSVTPVGLEWGQPERVAGGRGLKVVGPVCESADVLARDPAIDPIGVGDVLAFLEAGAYCRSMASTYNLRKLPPTVYVQADTLIL
jgi:diaminopimelate decarboxylase